MTSICITTILICCSSLASAYATPPPAGTAALAGRVYDLAAGREDGGIVSVEVHVFELTGDEVVAWLGLDANRAPDHRSVTNLQGDYEVESVRPGPVRIKFVHEGYIQYPTVTKVDLDEDHHDTIDVAMLNSNLVTQLDEEYIARVSSNVLQDVERAETDAQREQAYEAITQQLDNFEVSASFKRQVYGEIARRDVAAAAISEEIRDYVMTAQDDIEKATQTFRGILVEGQAANFEPTRHLPGLVIGDVARPIIRNEPVSDQRVSEFLQSLESQLGTDKAGAAIQAIERDY